MTPEELTLKRAKAAAYKAAECRAHPERQKAANAAWYKRHHTRALRMKAAAYKADPAKFNARTDAWQKANPVRAAELSRTGKQTKQEILAGRPRPDVCEVCGIPSVRTLHFDHCHATGMFRGWLCSGCNAALGHTHDSIATLEKLAAYLRAARL